MKIAFDENIPTAMVRIFQILANEKQLRWLSDGLTVKSAADYTPKRGDPDYDKNNDAPWIRRFAADGGSAIISGDTNMRRQPHERLALVQQGMVTIFFEPKWSKWVFFRKCSAAAELVARHREDGEGREAGFLLACAGKLGTGRKTAPRFE